MTETWHEWSYFLGRFWCISACGITPIRVYSRMRKFTNPLVFPHVDIHRFPWISAPKNTRKFTDPLILTNGNTPFRLYFHMWKYTNVCVFPRERKYTIPRELPHVDIHQFVCISTCADILNSAWISARGKFADFGVFPHGRRYTIPLEFPHVDIRWFSCIPAHN
jgi:hypothetical protein